jgi:hypothetical protein
LPAALDAPVVAIRAVPASRIALTANARIRLHRALVTSSIVLSRLREQNESDAFKIGRTNVRFSSNTGKAFPPTPAKERTFRKV